MMNTQNLEKTKKIIVPVLISIGGFWSSYMGYYYIPFIYRFYRFNNYQPSEQMLQKAWENFDFNPQNRTAEQIEQALKRSRTLNTKMLCEFTDAIRKCIIFLNKERQQDDPDNLKVLTDVVGIEIDFIMEQSRKCVMQFLQYKNHSYENFYFTNFQEQQDQQIILLIQHHTLEQIFCVNYYKQKLPSLNYCIESLKKINPFIKRNKHRMDRIRDMVEQNGQINFLYLYRVQYLTDVISRDLKLEFQTIMNAQRYIYFEKLRPNLKIEAQKLYGGFNQLCASLNV